MTLKERAALRKEEEAYAASQTENGFPQEKTMVPGADYHHPYHPPAAAAAAPSYTPSPPATPKPAPRNNNALYVMALYDYDSQTEGDLCFQKDDKIEVIQRTDDQNDWWTGKLCRTGATGIFPGKSFVMHILVSLFTYASTRKLCRYLIEVLFFSIYPPLP